MSLSLLEKRNALTVMLGLKEVWNKILSYTHQIFATENMKNITKKINAEEKEHDSSIFINKFIKIREF